MTALKVVMFPSNHDLVRLYARALRTQGVQVALLPSFHYAAPWNFLRLIWLRLRGFTVIHVHWLFFYPPFLLPIFQHFVRWLGFSVVWEVHNVNPHEGSREVGGRARTQFYAETDAIIVHYEANRKDLTDAGFISRETHVIPHPHFSIAPDLPSRAQARQQLGLAPDAFVFLVFGRITQYKGHEVLLDAIRLTDWPGVCWIIAGAPVDEDLAARIRIASQADKRIVLIAKHLSEEEIGLLHVASDWAVQPHLAITTSGSVLMSQTYGLPVITSYSAAMQEATSAQKAILVPAGDAIALQTAMRDAREDRSASEIGRGTELGLTGVAIAREFRRVYSQLRT